MQTELHNWKRKPGDELYQLYNEVCHLMSLAYQGPSCNQSKLVRRDALLYVLNDPSLRVNIVDKVLGTMEQALHITLNVEALDNLKDAKTTAK